MGPKWRSTSRALRGDTRYFRLYPRQGAFWEYRAKSDGRPRHDIRNAATIPNERDSFHAAAGAAGDDSDSYSAGDTEPGEIRTATHLHAAAFGFRLREPHEAGPIVDARECAGGCAFAACRRFREHLADSAPLG